MAYETLLNVTPAIASVSGSVVNSAGYNATIFFNIGNTTLGSALSDEVCSLTLSTSAAGTALSAYPASVYGSPIQTSSIILSLSSASAIPTTITHQGVISNSTFSAANSAATLSITFVSPELATTVLNLSANHTATVLDPTKTSTLDNFFFVTSNGGVRTTHGQARLVSFLG